jgi:hypothetical protein
MTDPKPRHLVPLDALLEGMRREHDTLRPEDRDALRAIEQLTDAHDAQGLARAILAYYRDGDRADRTPRPFLYLHLGILSGLLSSKGGQ